MPYYVISSLDSLSFSFLKRDLREREKSLVKLTWKIKVSGFMWINCSETEWISKLVDKYLRMPVMSSWNSTAKQSKAALKGPKWLHSDSKILRVIIFATDLNKIHLLIPAWGKKVTRRMVRTIPVMSPWHNSVWGQTQVYCWKALVYKN